MISEVPLKNLLIETKDGEWGKGESVSNHKKMLVIRGTDFSNVRFGSLKGVPTRFIPEHIGERKKLHAADILIETAGGTKDQPTGRTVFLKERIFKTSPFPLTCSSFTRFLRINSGLADPEYVFWYLQFLYETGKMEQHQVQHTGVARFQYTNFSEKILIPLPSLPEQRTIAHILGTLDDKIELNCRMNETLEAMAQAFFKSWFVDFDPVRAKAEGRPTGLPKEIEDLFPEGFEESELGEIPRGWKIVDFSDVANHKRQNVRPDQINSKTPYIGLEHMPRKSIALSDWSFSDEIESNKSEFTKGDILFGKLRSYFHKVGVAPVNGICSTDILVLTPIRPEWFGFVLGHSSSDSFVAYTDRGSSGTRMPRTSWEIMKRYKVVLPPVVAAECFTLQIKLFVKIILNNIHESKTLGYLRDSLLPKLLSGEIKVLDIPLLQGSTGELEAK